MLRRSYNQGIHTAFLKFALAPPTQVDEFLAGVENGKDVPPDPSTDALADAGVSEGADAMPLPEDPAMAQGETMGGMAAKSAGLPPGWQQDLPAAWIQDLATNPERGRRETLSFQGGQMTRQPHPSVAKATPPPLPAAARKAPVMGVRR